jgi:uncharacterized membrane protein YccC
VSELQPNLTEAQARVARASTEQYLTRAKATKQEIEQALSEVDAAAERSDRTAMAAALERVERLQQELMAIRSEQLAHHEATVHDLSAHGARRHKAAIWAGSIGIVVGVAGAWAAHAAGVI